MKFLEKFISPKKLTVIHTLVCFALIIVMFFLSFGTIFTLDVGKGGEVIGDITDAIEELEEEAGEEFPDIEVPTEINVSFPFILKSAIGGIKVVPVLVDSVKEMAEKVEDAENTLNEDALAESAMENGVEKTAEEASEKVEDVEDAGLKIVELINQDLINLICLIIAVINAFTTNFIVGVCYALILVVVIMVPISCIFNAILCIVSIIKNRQDPGKAFHRVGKSFSAIISKFPLILIVKALVPEVQLGGAIIAMFVTIVIGLIISFLASRLKGYEKAELKYLNVLQICSAVSLVAFLVFFFNMAKTHMLDAFFNKSGSYLMDQVGSLVENQKVDFLPLLLIYLFVFVLIMICNYLVDIVTRIACMSSSKSDTHIFKTAAGLALVVIPFVLMNTDFKLELGEAEMSSFYVYGVGLILMLVVEIVLKVLSHTVDADISAERRKEIVTGEYVHELDEAANGCEAAVAEEMIGDAATEEAPTEEETPTEEAPAEEETPTEEADAEEAAPEEATAEEAAAEETNE